MRNLNLFSHHVKHFALHVRLYISNNNLPNLQLREYFYLRKTFAYLLLGWVLCLPALAQQISLTGARVGGTGQILVFPYVTTKSGEDTYLSITKTYTAWMNIYMFDSSGSPYPPIRVQSNSYGTRLKMSDLMPLDTGYVIVVGYKNTPGQCNSAGGTVADSELVLTGRAEVRSLTGGTAFSGAYLPLTISALGSVNLNSADCNFTFNFTGYLGDFQQLPNKLVMPFISPLDKVGQTIVGVGLTGTAGTFNGFSPTSTTYPTLFYKDGAGLSFTQTALWYTGSVQKLCTLTTQVPRVAGGFGGKFPAGSSGYASINIQGGWGLMLVPPSTATGGNVTRGIINLTIAGYATNGQLILPK